MKKILVVIFILFSISMIAAESLPGFWGISWGSSSDEIEKAMIEKGYQVRYKTPTGMLYENISFAGRTGTIAFLFRDLKFITGTFMFEPAIRNVYQSYQSLKGSLIEKYGTPQQDTEIYTPPYGKGDGYTETAISLNYLKLNSYWIFDDGNNILLSISKNEKSKIISIMLSYYDGKAQSEILLEKKKSTLGDL